MTTPTTGVPHHKGFAVTTTMIMPSLSSSARAALVTRLEDLQAQRAQVAVESIPATGAGDAADHAGNVEALVRLGELDARIAALQVQLQAPDADARPAEVAEIGSLVRIRFDDDPDTQDYLIGLVEQAGSGVEVITPTSPLGSVLLGARPGDQLSYKVASGAIMHVTLEEIAG
jgi:transcription elongation factor GreA